ncbi:dihydrofolate reductase family protein [Pengzhenrongella sicca]|uniref:Dihydrofolate reductase family protein n=1 Tax=Pengzhenrongella sicca TaxID=2819238 RepID=A0A8A4Z8Q9_9MICO|nr:dihydrofolate reductase family protein [Pengzhenrongella sicca]QTE28310.1 dihydrofolate reductase family protein [Pengzhenrongella sicca]
MPAASPAPPPVPPSALPPTAERPTLDVLLPLARAGERLPADPGEAALTALYDHPLPAPAPGALADSWVRANMIASLDGAAAGADRRSGSLNGPADLRVFRVLRAAADVVLVGAGTARAEGYGALRVPAELAAARAARGQRPDLPLALVSRSGEIPAGLLDSGDPPLVVTVADRPDLAALQARIGADRVLVAGDREVDLPAALAALRDRGLTRVLTEGGPRLLGSLLTAGLVDELCLTWSPLLVGGPAPRAVDGAPWLRPAVSARPAHLLHSDAVLLGRWLL